MRRSFWFQTLSLLAVVFLWAGCATHKIDWNSRMGVYTYDQTVLEMGPPDKVARLTDGTIVAEWLTYRGSSGYSGFFPGPYYPFPTYDLPTPDRFLRLTFTPDGKLKEWKKIAR